MSKTLVSYNGTNGGLSLIKAILHTPEWAKDVKSLYNGGELLENLEPHSEPKPNTEELQEAFNARHKTWSDSTTTFDMTTSQYEALKVCFNFHVSKGAILPTKHARAVITFLDLPVT